MPKERSFTELGNLSDCSIFAPRTGVPVSLMNFYPLNQTAEHDPSSSRKEIIFIINPISGTKSKESLEQRIHQLMDESRFRVHTVLTEFPGHATRLAAEAAREGFAYVVAIGGDGTVNEVAQSLVYTNTALGIIPMGSGNGLARHLGIPVHLSKALQCIGHQRTVVIDSCTLNDIPFFCTAGVGFDAHVGHLFAQRKRRGFGTYLQTSLREFFNYRPDTYAFTMEGQTERRKAFTITFANAAQYGNNAYIAPQADIQDGMLDVTIIRPFPYPVFLDLGIRLFSKTLHSSAYVDIIRTNEVMLQGEAPLLIHLDGEPHTTGNSLLVKVKPSSLKVMVG